jgi:hypothetical protein
LLRRDVLVYLFNGRNNIMTDILIPGRTRETQICLQTRRGNPIPNAQFYELSSFELAQVPDLSRKYLGIIVRTLPNPIYNCHGLTFASRRTGIYEADFSEILDNDGYTEVSADQTLPGDIVLYFDEKGSIQHSGIVVERPQQSLLNVPIILSKWGKYGEIIHPAHVTPKEYGITRLYFRITK